MTRLEGPGGCFFVCFFSFQSLEAANYKFNKYSLQMHIKIYILLLKKVGICKENVKNGGKKRAMARSQSTNNTQEASKVKYRIKNCRRI